MAERLKLYFEISWEIAKLMLKMFFGLPLKRIRQTRLGEFDE